jgi:hypothetical protein
MTKPRTLSVFDLLSSPESMRSASDAVVNRATDAKAVKALTKSEVTDVTTALRAAADADEFAEIVNGIRATYGNHTDLARMGQVTAAAVKVSAAIRRTVIREAFLQGYVGQGKQYATQAALAAAVGVTPAYVTQNKPTPKDASKANSKGRPAKVTEPEVTEDDAPATSTDTSPIVALQQALTRLESASKRAFTPSEAEDVRRVANALRNIAARLDDVAKVDHAA